MVKIYGPGDIDSVSASRLRTPLVQADAETFGSGIARAFGDFGETAVVFAKKKIEEAAATQDDDDNDDWDPSMFGDRAPVAPTGGSFVDPAEPEDMHMVRREALDGMWGRQWAPPARP